MRTYVCIFWFNLRKCIQFINVKKQFFVHITVILNLLDKYKFTCRNANSKTNVITKQKLYRQRYMSFYLNVN